MAGIQQLLFVLHVKNSKNATRIFYTIYTAHVKVSRKLSVPIGIINSQKDVTE